MQIQQYSLCPWQIFVKKYKNCIEDFPLFTVRIVRGLHTVFTRVQVDPPFWSPKMFFLFLGKNFLEKLILYFLEFSFRYYGYMKKITASLDVKFIVARTRAF